MLLLALGAVGSSAGCLSDEVDGTWRHPVEHEPTNGPAYELALGQYGPEVAGLVRLFRAATEGGDAYARPESCTLLTNGEVTGDVLRFLFQDPDGVPYSATLDIGEERLSGFLEQDGGRAVHHTFERIDTEVDKDCEGRTEAFSLHGIVQGDELLDGDLTKLRVGLFYTGVEQGARFWVPRNIVRLDSEAPTFNIEVNRLPDPRMLRKAPTDGSLRFAYALFLAYVDTDGDGAWDREVLGEGGAEPLVGVAADHALAYLEGKGSSVFSDRPALLDELEQGFNLVKVHRDDDTDEITVLRPVDPARANVLILPVESAKEPFLERD